MLRRVIATTVLGLITSVALSAPPKTSPQPTEVKIVSVPPAQPTEVKIVSTPPASPVEMRIVSTPPDESAYAMVRLTQWLVGANVLLCGVTVWGSWKQSRDLKQRDRAAMEREIRRGAQKNMAVAIWLNQMALQIPALAKRVGRLAEDIDRIDQLKVDSHVPKNLGRDVEHILETRQKRLSEITVLSLKIVSNHMINFEKNSDREARTLLGIVDSNDVQLESMRDEITSDSARFDSEIARLVKHITAMQAAALARD